MSFLGAVGLEFAPDTCLGCLGWRTCSRQRTEHRPHNAFRFSAFPRLPSSRYPLPRETHYPDANHYLMLACLSFFFFAPSVSSSSQGPQAVDRCVKLADNASRLCRVIVWVRKLMAGECSPRPPPASVRRSTSTCATAAAPLKQPQYRISQTSTSRLRVRQVQGILTWIATLVSAHCWDIYRTTSSLSLSLLSHPSILAYNAFSCLGSHRLCRPAGHGSSAEFQFLAHC